MKMEMERVELLAVSAAAPVAGPRTLGRGLLSLMPFGIIGGLIFAALFIKPVIEGTGVPRPVMEKRDRFYGVVMTSPEAIWAAGNDGKIVRSADGGKIWVAQDSGTSVHLQSIAAWDADRAVAVGNRGTVLRTDDGGKQWRPGTVPAMPNVPKLMRVRVAAGGAAWAVGEMGTVLVSEDYGKDWKPAPTKTEDMSWNDIGFAGNRGCLVGEFGRIRCTADRGVTWDNVEPPVASSLNAVVFRSETEAIAVGLEGVVLHTTDGGAHWRLLPKATELHLYDVTWDGTRWVAVGDRGVTLTGDATASRWTDVTKVVASASWHTQVSAISGRYVLAGQGITLARLDEKDN